MDARPIGQIVRPQIAEAVIVAGIGTMINALQDDDAGRKRLILILREEGAISDREAELLIGRGHLEAA